MRNAVVLLVCLLPAFAVPANYQTEPATDFRVVGYLPNYRAADFDLAAARGLTDLIVFSAEPASDGGLSLDRLKKLPWTRLREFKTRQRVRLLLCVGGWERSKHFAAVSASDQAREKFAKSAVKVCLDERLDGIDFDWEHPKSDKEEAAYAALLEACRDAFRPHGLVLSVTMAPWQKLPGTAWRAVDAVQIMSYDHKGRHSTFDAAKADVKALLDQGAPKEKIVLGLPFYGRGVTDSSKTLTYRQLVGKFKLPPETDEVDSIYFNGPATIRRKTQFALESGLGGVMVWELGQDAEGKQSLLGVIREAVGSYSN
jgi:GH18 family chitinase